MELHVSIGGPPYPPDIIKRLHRKQFHVVKLWNKPYLDHCMIYLSQTFWTAYTHASAFLNMITHMYKSEPLNKYNKLGYKCVRRKRKS